MKAVEIYTKESCPFCVRAKQLLTQKGVAFVEHNLEGKPDELEALKKKTGWRTVPQIFIGGELIGGFSELSALEFSGKLDERLGTH
jgi:glutaredoxin 3